jgi:hypothetical protein
MNYNKKKFPVSIPESLYSVLKTYQEQNQLDSIDSAVVEILTQFFQLEAESKRYATVEQLNSLAEKVDRLSQQVTALSQVKDNHTSTAVSSPTQTTQQKQPLTDPVVSDDWEDIEDEPDEILYDFLDYQ